MNTMILSCSQTLPRLAKFGDTGLVRRRCLVALSLRQRELLVRARLFDAAQAHQRLGAAACWHDSFYRILVLCWSGRGPRRP